MYLGKKSPILKATPCWWSEWQEKFLAHLIFTGIYWCHTNATQCNRGDCIATGWSKTLYCLHTRCMYVRMYTYIHHVRWPFLWGDKKCWKCLNFSWKSMLQSSNSQICKGLFRQCYIFCCLTRPAGEIIFIGKLLFFKGCQLSTYLRTTNAKWGLHTTYSWNIKWQKCAGMGLNGFIFKKINEN